jgi:aquaporin Z
VNAPEPLRAVSRPIDAFRRHWPEYLIETVGLGLFMISAGVFTTLLEYPGSAISGAIADPWARRALIGLAMGATSIGLIYSPWGARSGAHFNPAVTLTFYRLGKVAPWDAAFYAGAQILGGLMGVLLARAALGRAFGEPPVHFAVTVPGMWGLWTAFTAEFVIALGLMTTVLYTSNHLKLMRYTGLFAGFLVTLYITLEAPFSGMSMNPARTLATALPSGVRDGLWLYFVAPPLGMLLAVDVYRLITGRSHVLCAKLNHATPNRCIFRHCGFKKHTLELSPGGRGTPEAPHLERSRSGRTDA